MSGKGDTDPKAYTIGIIAGVVGGLLGARAAIVLCPLLAVFIYQMGLDIPKAPNDELQSQGQRGSDRFFIILFASMMPAFCGIIAGAVIGQLVHGNGIFPKYVDDTY